MRPLSGTVLGAQLHWLRRRPRAYLGAWWAAVRGNARSPRFLVRALVVVPLAATFARRMDELGIDHIHAHWATHPALAAYVASRLCGIPYSFTAHAHDIYVERPMLEEKIRRATFVVTISEFNRRFLQGLYGRELSERVVVVHCGTDTTVFRPPPPRESGRWTVVCVASLQPQKGQRFLIAACRRLMDQGLPIHCVLVGDGEMRPALEAQIRDAGLGEVVELVGQQPRPRVVELIGNADVVVQPSVVLPSGKMEGIPVALMEALAMERPVVATAISGVSELVEHEVTGLLVAPASPEQLADAIGRLYRDDQFAARLGQAGRQRVVRDFDLMRSARVLADRFSTSRR
ncbi:MAG TPA: glycosyltransferase [Candidatus Limnocylindria bacterium]|nr:glycosyltransferase [Candidatus Limnocylindria bacterium]